jgi:hypothetical protein
MISSSNENFTNNKKKIGDETGVRDGTSGEDFLGIP